MMNWNGLYLHSYYYRLIRRVENKVPFSLQNSSYLLTYIEKQKKEVINAARISFGMYGYRSLDKLQK